MSIYLSFKGGYKEKGVWELEGGHWIQGVILRIWTICLICNKFKKKTYNNFFFFSAVLQLG